MCVRPWLNPTSASDNTTETSPEHIVSDSGNCSDATYGSTSYSSEAGSASTSASSCLQSNFSLQTFPSVPSLHKFSEEISELSSSSASQVEFTSLIPPSRRPISCTAVKGNLLYAASGHEVQVYDRVNLDLVDAFNSSDSSSGSVKAVSFLDGRIFTAHQDGMIRVWKMSITKQHKLMGSLPTVQDKLLRFILPQNYVAVRRHKRRLWIEHVDAVTGVAIRNGLIYSVSWDKTLKVWRASDLRCMESVKCHDDAVNAVAVAGDGTVYTGSADRRIRVWSRPFGEKRHVLVATLEKHKSAVNALALNGDGSVLFSGACDRSILVWEREDSAKHMGLVGALRGHSGAILCLINVSDLLFSGSADKTVRIWQRGEDGRHSYLAVLDGHRKPVKTLTVVPDGDDKNGGVSVYSGGLDGEIKVFRVSLNPKNSMALNP